MCTIVSFWCCSFSIGPAVDTWLCRETQPHTVSLDWLCVVSVRLEKQNRLLRHLSTLSFYFLFFAVNLLSVEGCLELFPSIMVTCSKTVGTAVNRKIR